MKTYENREDLMNGLAQIVASEVDRAIKERGQASLAVPGGTTPAPFLRALSQADIDWAKVSVLLGDERFVDETSPRSNAKLVRENLLQNHAAQTQFVPLYKTAKEPEEVIDELRAAIVPCLPIDVLIVGMGEDMHTASLFPDSPDLEEALADDAPPLVIVRAENAGEPRISLSAPVLRAARHKHVLIAGENKLAPLAQAQNAASETIAPIRAVIAGDHPATIHYAP